MKILATFDGSVFSESIIPELQALCRIPGSEVVLLRVAEMPHGQLAAAANAPLIPVAPPSSGGLSVIAQGPPTAYAENKEQAVERVKAELHDYLHGLARQLPGGVPCRVETILDSDVRSAIVRFAIQTAPDVIVMATHGRTGLVHVLFGDVAESVLRSGVAPVLLVPPHEIAQSRRTDQETGSHLRPSTVDEPNL